MHAFPVHFLQILLFMFKLIYSHCGIPIWDLFVYSLLCVCGIAETWIPYTDFDLLKSHFCTGTNYWNVSCKFDDMLQNFCVFDNRLQFKKTFIILGYLTIVTFVILFCCWKIEDIHFLLCLHWGLNIKTQSMIKLHFRCPITFNLKVCDIINKGINSDSIWHITSKMCNAQSDFFPVSGRGC